jgi:hypothetical protein
MRKYGHYPIELHQSWEASVGKVPPAVMAAFRVSTVLLCVGIAVTADRMYTMNLYLKMQTSNQSKLHDALMISWSGFSLISLPAHPLWPVALKRSVHLTHPCSCCISSWYFSQDTEKTFLG